MALFKCKMCGGTIEFEQGETVGVCDSCGIKQTLPKLDDKKQNLYDRANHFRRNNEYDKAMGIYEQILNEDITDAEAYWSLVLCRYGIEYVEDPATRKRVPTVNRAQFTSIFDDDNYRSALQYADVFQREIYEEEAKAINEIQKGILEISNREEPFDIFICYKETDNSGRRTHDSVLANDLYHQLVQEGFKVFFARITLEDKLGTAYEPYIFAALNSAKVMVVLGTKPEFFSATWVKNEWSRYLALIKAGAKKTLIPAYRDMDPYDLPEEFSHLQALDMSKLGFMQDLIRGIKKITQVDEPKVVAATVANTGSDGANLAVLIKRAFVCIEDHEWDNAKEFCEKIMNIDPECAQVYLARLLIDLRVETPDKLIQYNTPFDKNGNYLKAVRYGDEKLKSELTGYASAVKERCMQTQYEQTYNEAYAVMGSAGDEEAYKRAAELFASIAGYRDAEILSKSCAENAEQSRLEKIYSEACRYQDEATAGSGKINLLRQSIEMFEGIRDYKDSSDRVSLLNLKMDALIKETERNKKRNKKIVTITGISLVAAVVIALLSVYVIIPASRYSSAEKDIAAGNYDEAIETFVALGDYKDSADKVTEAKYAKAGHLLETEKFDESISLFTELGDYKDSADKVLAVKYARAMEFLESENYDEAHNLFVELGDYSNSAEMMYEVDYARASRLLDDGEYAAAYDKLRVLVKYMDCAEKYKESAYQYACSMKEKYYYETAIEIFKEIEDYEDASELLNNCYDEAAELYYATEQFQAAVDYYEKTQDFDEESERYKEYLYALGRCYLNGYSPNSSNHSQKIFYEIDYQKAVNIFSRIEGYKDSTERKKQAMNRLN